MKREFLQNFKIGDQSMPKEVIDSILDENGRDLEALKASNEALEDRLKTAEDGLKAFEGVDISQLQGIRPHTREGYNHSENGTHRLTTPENLVCNNRRRKQEYGVSTP